MSIIVSSIDGHSINDGTNYVAIIPDDAPLQGQTRATFVKRRENWPAFAEKTFSEMRFPVIVAVRSGSMATLMQWFDTGQREPVKLIGIEGGVSYSRMVTPEQVIYQSPTAIKVILATADPVWRRETLTTATWAISGTGDTHAQTVGGNRYTEPTLSFSIASTGGYAYKRFVIIRNRVTDAPLKNYAIDVTGGGLNTSALVSAGRMQADGDDWRMMVDGQEVPRWMSAAPSASSANLLFIVTDLAAGVSLKLGTAIPASGAVGEISFVKSTDNDKALKKLPESGILQIDNELFTYTSRNLTARKVGGVSRAAKGTSMASHSANASVYWIEHDAWMMYGNASATTPEQDESRAPAFDVATSTNTSWVYSTVFADETGLRAGSWKASVEDTDGKQSLVYTATQGATADPASVIGLQLNPWEKKGKYLSETGTVRAWLYNPCGIATVASTSGLKMRGDSSWPKVAGLQRSKNGSKWTTVWNETTPATADVWTAWSRGSSSTSNDDYVAFTLSGTVKGQEGQQASFEVGATNATFPASTVPLVTLLGEAAQVWVDFTVENTTTAESFKLAYPMTGSATLTVDCEARTVRSGSENIFGAISGTGGRRHWLRFEPGVNNLVITGSVGTITATITYPERLL